MSVAENSVRFACHAPRPASGYMPKRGMSRKFRLPITRSAPLRQHAHGLYKPKQNMDTPSQRESGNPGSSSLPILPLRVELKPADSLTSLRAAISLDDLASQLTTTAIVELQKFVAKRNPLEDPALSSWLWLRTDGSIDVVYDTDAINRRLKGDSKRALFLEVFKCGDDATPNSKFHSWVFDASGRFVGDIGHKVAELCPLWDRRSSERATDRDVETIMTAFGFQQFRLEPYSAAEISTAIASPGYTELLNARIKTWVERGDYALTVERLTLDGLTSAVRTHGNRFAYKVGRRKLFANLASKVKDSLASRVLSTIN